jgi:hypothetical protein
MATVLLIAKIILVGILIWSLHIASKIHDIYGILGHLFMLAAVLFIGYSIFWIILWTIAVFFYIIGFYKLSIRNIVFNGKSND